MTPIRENHFLTNCNVIIHIITLAPCGLKGAQMLHGCDFKFCLFMPWEGNILTSLWVNCKSVTHSLAEQLQRFHEILKVLHEKHNWLVNPRAVCGCCPLTGRSKCSKPDPVTLQSAGECIMQYTASDCPAHSPHIYYYLICKWANKQTSSEDTYMQC